jgi:hypothetical protein
MLLFLHVTEDYPEFTDYVYYRFPSVLDSTTIVHNMAVFGSLDRSSFAAALSPGTPPYIDVSHMLIGGFGRMNSHDLGAMQCSTRLIVLESLLVERFDWDPTSVENMFTTASGRKAPMVGLSCCTGCVIGEASARVGSIGQRSGPLLAVTMIRVMSLKRPYTALVWLFRYSHIE